MLRVPFKFVGYCDESEDATSLVLVCVFARAADWPIIVRPWRALLEEFEIPEFHAEHCEHRKGAWESWADPTERSAAASRFIDLIVLNLLPFPAVYATAVDLAAFYEIAAPVIRKAKPGKRLDAPWLLAFHQVLEDMLHAQGLANDLGIPEKIDLIFDEKKEFCWRVQRRATEVKESKERPLADVRFANSDSAVGLQIADLIAYEARKAITAVIRSDATSGIRDQWMHLMGAMMPGGQSRIYANFWDKAAMRRGDFPPGLV